MRVTVSEVSDQKNNIPQKFIKKKKSAVQISIDNLSSCFSNYSSLNVLHRPSMSHESLRLKQQTSLSLFQLFFSLNLIQIMTNHINMKTAAESTSESIHHRLWHDITATEIEAFVNILLYMNIIDMSRVPDYWNTNLLRAVYSLVINCMRRVQWEQIKRYLKIFNPNEDKLYDTWDSDWWKKLKSLATEFRKASKSYWLLDSHVSVDEQLVKFRGRCCHVLQIASKAAGVKFKLYSLCQENFLYDFLFISKVGLEFEAWS